MPAPDPDPIPGPSPEFFPPEPLPPPLGAGAPGAARGRADPYAPWRIPAYRRFAASSFLMFFGKMIETVAMLVYVHDQTAAAGVAAAPLALGLIGLVQAVPMIVLAVAGGQIADRVDRRRVLMTMLAMSTLVSVGLTLAAVWDLPIGWFYLILGAGAITRALGSPARAALLPQIVPLHIFSDAVAWNSTMFQIASMIGPAVGGLVVGFSTTPANAFALVAVCRLLSFAAIAALRCRLQQRSAESISLASVLAGIRFVGRTRLILATITLDMFAVLLGGATYLLPIFAARLNPGAWGEWVAWASQAVGLGSVESMEAVIVGLLRSAEAVGAVTMAVLLTHLPPMRRAGRDMLWAVAGFGAATIVFGLSRSLWLSISMMVLIGALDNVSVVVRHTLVQMLTPDPMRGRVSAVNGIFITASNDLGGMESGVTAWLFGPVAAVVAGGIGAILAVVAAARIWPEILRVGSLRDVRPGDDP